jgi:hypothetical protein
VIDNIITNTLLAAKKSLAKEPIIQAIVTAENNDFACEWILQALVFLTVRRRATIGEDHGATASLAR